MPLLRTLLVLGRVSNLPTVWSNCLAGWWLGGGGNSDRLPFLFIGTTFLYLGGMFLNDAFDVEFDRQHRKERPLPSGAISLTAVWCWGWLWFALGEVCLFRAGTLTGMLGLVLLGGILLYDAIHKLIPFSAVLMGLCRFLVFIVAASTGIHGVTGWAMWCGLALGAYVTGLSFLARGESTRSPIRHWPLALLAVPILLALIMNVGSFRGPALLLSGALAVWTLHSLRSILWAPVPQTGRTIAGLLAGIVLVDLLAALELLVRTDGPWELAAFFPVFFVLALLLQRFVPAT